VSGAIEICNLAVCGGNPAGVEDVVWNGHAAALMA
jgi:hypothetical protein